MLGTILIIVLIAFAMFSVLAEINSIPGKDDVPLKIRKQQELRKRIIELDKKSSHEQDLRKMLREIEKDKPTPGEYWLADVQEQQNNRYRYTDPVTKPKDTTYVYNETARMWVSEEQMDKVASQLAYEKNRRKWEKLKLEEELQQTMRRDPIHLTPEEKELSKQMYVDKTEPSFEEWKAAREKERQSQK